MVATKLKRFDIPFDMIVSRRVKFRGFGLDERVYYGLWRDERGRPRRIELCRLGSHFTLDGALSAAGEGMARHPAGTRAYRWFADWAARLKATERALVRCEDRYWARVRGHCAGLPEHGAADPLPVAAE